MLPVTFDISVKYTLEMIYILATMHYTTPHIDFWTMYFWTCIPIVLFMWIDFYLPNGSNEIRVIYAFCLYILSRVYPNPKIDLNVIGGYGYGDASV